MQNFWEEYLKSLSIEKIDHLPGLFFDLLTKIDHWLEMNAKLSKVSNKPTKYPQTSKTSGFFRN